MLTALDAAGNQMRLDECRTWTIMGKRGYVATWGEGARWFIYCAPGSARKWDNIHRALTVGLSKRPAVNPEVVKANLSRPSVSPVQGHFTRERPDPAHYATQEAADFRCPRDDPQGRRLTGSTMLALCISPNGSPSISMPFPTARVWRQRARIPISVGEDLPTRTPLSGRTRS